MQQPDIGDLRRGVADVGTYPEVSKLVPPRLNGGIVQLVPAGGVLRQERSQLGNFNWRVVASNQVNELDGGPDRIETISLLDLPRIPLFRGRPSLLFDRFQLQGSVKVSDPTMAVGIEESQPCNRL